MALMNVMIVSSVALVIVTSLTTSLVTENVMMTEAVNANNAYYLANGCAEEGLMRIRRDLNYSGGTLTIDAQSDCTVTISNVGSNFILVAQGNSYGQTQRIQVSFTLSSEFGLRDGENNVFDRHSLNVSSWEKI